MSKGLERGGAGHAVKRSAITGKVKIFDHPITMPCSAGKPWVHFDTLHLPKHHSRPNTPHQCNCNGVDSTNSTTVSQRCLVRLDMVCLLAGAVADPHSCSTLD